MILLIIYLRKYRCLCFLLLNIVGMCCCNLLSCHPLLLRFANLVGKYLCGLLELVLVRFIITIELEFVCQIELPTLNYLQIFDVFGLLLTFSIDFVLTIILLGCSDPSTMGLCLLKI